MVLRKTNPEMVVSDLMLNGEGRWNETLIEEILDLEDTMVMFSMPLANLQEEDVRIWRHNRNDKYSVKLTYHNLRENILDTC